MHKSIIKMSHLTITLAVRLSRTVIGRDIRETILIQLHPANENFKSF